MWRKIAVVATSIVTLTSCATKENQGDPLEPINRQVYRFNSGVDALVLRPLASGYAKITPSPIKTGIHNFFSNIDDVLVGGNNFLQGNAKNGFSDVARIVVNTTIGVVGLIDVASKMGLEKHDADLGQTLGKWGVGSGAYLVLPFFGSTTLRDTSNIVADVALYNNISKEASTRDKLLPFKVLDVRAQLLGVESFVDAGGSDEYAFTRSVYLQGRESKITGVTPSASDEFDPGPTPETTASSPQ
ncbi:VacJ family lipoprotein [Leeia sp. TBRC 13508]|uniref:VacJ family lipoprotein n=1 Tax=Leeia speluncae TaxID=2884804 RepID=A0ABS8D6M6_9NEIS|nr:VacJ family lipoprotein [Leeia speluncae]MCB6183673.1 VacJ family lipoprotein [Leeia speluncae]